MAKTFTTTSAALFIALTKALDKYPEEEQRILKGATIANQPYGVLEHDWSTTVQSSGGTRQYTIQNGRCECFDRSPRCKHRFAQSLARKAAYIHKDMLAPENVKTVEVGHERGIVHTAETGVFFVPYGGPRGRFITSADYVEGSRGTDWPTVQAEKERWEAAYYLEYNEIA